jgi:hypothetical protein
VPYSPRPTYSNVKLAVRQGVLRPAESVARTSSRYSPFDNWLTISSSPIGIY